MNGKWKIGLISVTCFLAGGCDLQEPMSLPAEFPHSTQYVNTSTRVDIDADEWIIYEILDQRGLLEDTETGPSRRCSYHPKALTIPKRQATYVRNLGGLSTVASNGLQKLVAQDKIGPVSYGVPVGKFQRITTEENWQSYFVTVNAYHMKSQNGVDVLLALTTAPAVEFLHLRGWTPHWWDCDDQGSAIV